MNYLYAVIFLLTLPSIASSSSNQLNFQCVIYNELEDGALPQKKIYKNRSLKLYLDINNNWLNDMPFNKKLIQKNIIYSLQETEVNFTSLKKKLLYNREKRARIKR